MGNGRRASPGAGNSSAAARTTPCHSVAEFWTSGIDVVAGAGVEVARESLRGHVHLESDGVGCERRIGNIIEIHERQDAIVQLKEAVPGNDIGAVDDRFTSGLLSAGAACDEN